MENCSPSVMKRLTKEVLELVQQPLEGIRIAVNEANLADIHATIDGPEDTPYAGGRFSVRLIMGGGYPQEPPAGFFLTRIFHPNIAAPSGEICVNTLKRDWTPDTGLRHLLLVIKCLLIVPNAESALNQEAGRLLLEDYSEYCSRARLFTEIHAMQQQQQHCAATGAAAADPGVASPVLRDSNDTSISDANGSDSSAAAASAATAGVHGAKRANATAGTTAAPTAAKRAKKALKRL